MPLRRILRLFLAGLLALLTSWPGGAPDTPPLRVGYIVAHADGPGDWPTVRRGVINHAATAHAAPGDLGAYCWACKRTLTRYSIEPTI